jgi:hypothetical protein
MKDIIKIASILEHNEKNPDNFLKLPEGLENTLTYQDALLYKAAKENGIKVISLEGRNLEHSKESASYNENREQYMANVINEVRSKGYNVIANVGSSHKANLEKALEEKPKQNIGFKNMPRKIEQKSLENNYEKTTSLVGGTPKEVLQQALVIAKPIQTKMVSTKPTNRDHVLQQSPLTNTQLKKSAQGRE